MSTTRWAVLGPGAIARDFAEGLRSSARGELHAVASSSPERADAFARTHGATVSGTYDEILARDDVDAVYVATVHTTHAELSRRALAAGKAVLCEKPASVTAVDTDAVLDDAGSRGLPYVEAFKYRFSPFTRGLLDAVADGAAGEVRRFEASFGFATLARTGRLFDPALAGGAILDVGCYPVSFAVAVAAAAGHDLARMRVSSAEGSFTRSGVDKHASAVLEVDGFAATVHTSIGRNLPRAIELVGTDAELRADDGWGSRHDSAARFTVDGEARSFETVDPFAAEADAVSAALAAGEREAPEMPWEQTRTIARLLDAWRAALV